jgi:hypothetical protein
MGFIRFTPDVSSVLDRAGLKKLLPGDNQEIAWTGSDFGSIFGK